MGNAQRQFSALFDVKLSDDPLIIVQPDIMVVCDKDKLNEKRFECYKGGLNYVNFRKNNRPAPGNAGTIA